MLTYIIFYDILVITYKELILKEIIEIFDEYLDKFLVTKELQQINFGKILKQFKFNLLSVDTFIQDSYFFNIESEIFNIKNNLDMPDMKEAYSGFTKFELKRYLYILEYFVFEIFKYRFMLVDDIKNYCKIIKLSGNEFISKLPSEIKDISELYIYDTKNKLLYVFFGNNDTINLFNLVVTGYTQVAKYKLNVPYYTLTNILNRDSFTTDFPLSTDVSNFSINKNMLIVDAIKKT